MTAKDVGEILLHWHENMNDCPLFELGQLLERGQDFSFNLVEDAKFKLIALYDGEYGHDLDMAQCWEIENAVIWLNKYIAGYDEEKEAVA